MGFDNQSIWKNSVYLGSDGSLYNGTKWRLNNDGSGRLANGNIVWDASGNVSFGSSVTLNWTNAATNALNQAKSYADTKRQKQSTVRPQTPLIKPTQRKSWLRRWHLARCYTVIRHFTMVRMA